LVVLDADAAEGLGEVDAEADGVGLGEFEDEAVAQAGGLWVVVVEGVFPERVGDLERGVDRTAVELLGRVDHFTTGDVRAPGHRNVSTKRGFRSRPPG
jgi:hypothetical protein